MAYHPKLRLEGRARRKVRVRKKIGGSGERPRVTVFRSAKHMYAQVVDDVKGVTLASSSSQRVQAAGKKVERAKQVGLDLAARCKEVGVTAVVFDRNGYRYHGRVRALAEGVRDGGIKV
jgi:large subunit ribosomal protein L18